MENKAICWWCIGAHYGSRDVPTLAAQDEAWGMVSQYGSSGTHRLVLYDGIIPTDPVRCNGVYGASRVMALP